MGDDDQQQPQKDPGPIDTELITRTPDRPEQPAMDPGEIATTSFSKSRNDPEDIDRHDG